MRRPRPPWTGSTRWTRLGRRSGTASVKGGKGQGRVKALPNQVHVDFDADLRRMDDAAWMLTAGFGGWIDAHAEAQADYYSDMAASSDYY